MWVFLNNAFVSIVALTGDDQDRLMVRARASGDISRFFGQTVEETRTTNTDYRYRRIVSREEVMTALAKSVEQLDYPNFKNSVKAHDRHDAYEGVWWCMFDFQSKRERPIAPPPAVPAKPKKAKSRKKKAKGSEFIYKGHRLVA